MTHNIVGAAVAVVLLVNVVVPLAAGGAEETIRSPSASSAQEAQEAQTDRSVEARMKALLDEVGVRTFRQEIDAVDFSLTNLAGEDVRLSDLRGQIVFLNFWATWCPPCREEMPSMERMQEELAGLPFQIVAVNLQEERDVVAEFVEEMGYTFPVVLDRTGGTAQDYGVRGIPTTFFLSPRGGILGMLVGTRYWDQPVELSVMRRMAELAASTQETGEADTP